MERRIATPLLIAAALLCTDAGPGAQSAGVRPVTWKEARPIVERFADRLPPSLHDIAAETRAARWSDWVEARRAEIAARLARGEVDSLVNLLLFGTSFTAAPRLTAEQLAELDRRWRAGDKGARQVLAGAYQRRSADLVAAAANPGTRERMQFARRVLARRGHDLTSAPGREAAAGDLLGEVRRVRDEAAALAATLQRAQSTPDARAAVAARAHLFRERGLAPDSSVLTQFAVEQALCAIRHRNALSAGSVTRVAIVGPGLDFADKQEGADFYEPQSLQPFTAPDSLIRCGLAAAGRLDVMTIDVSDRVNAHLRAAVARAARTGEPYELVLPRDSAAEWSDEAIAYWKTAGDRIGTPRAIAPPASLPGIQARGIAVRARIATALEIAGLDIVFDRPGAGFPRADLILATNVLLYYDAFEQALALRTIASMLRPGGLLLTNDAVDSAGERLLESGGEITVRFSARAGDGERMYWLRRADR